MEGGEWGGRYVAYDVNCLHRTSTHSLTVNYDPVLLVLFSCDALRAPMEKCHAKQLLATTFLAAIQNRWNQSASAGCLPVKQPFVCSLVRAPVPNIASVLLLSYYKASLRLVNFYGASSQDQGSNPETYPGPSLCHTLVTGASRPLSSLL